MARRVAFIGPSMPGACTWPAVIELRPPARRGDLARAVEDGVDAIALVDGLMIQGLPPSPREVEAAAARIPVIGAASLGALRAVECPSVIGVGEVWEGFRTGELHDEDEVVGTFDPETGRVIALPIVVVRDVLRRAGVPGVARIVRTLRGLPLPQRSAAELLRHVPAAAREEVVRALAKPDVKQRDAELALHHLAGIGVAGDGG